MRYRYVIVHAFLTKQGQMDVTYYEIDKLETEQVTPVRLS